MARFVALVQHAYMSDKKRIKHYLRAWREANDPVPSLEAIAAQMVQLSQDREKAGDGPAITMTHATLSRIERGIIPYNQNVLELLAVIYGTDAGSLIVQDPALIKPPTPEIEPSPLEELTPEQRSLALEMIKAIKRTGTDG